MVDTMMLESSEVIDEAMLKVCHSSRIPTELRMLLDRGLLDTKVMRLAERIGKQVYADRRALVWYIEEEESEWEDDEW
jgi:hypothetical protein